MHISKPSHMMTFVRPVHDDWHLSLEVRDKDTSQVFLNAGEDIGRFYDSVISSDTGSMGPSTTTDKMNHKTARVQPAVPVTTSTSVSTFLRAAQLNDTNHLRRCLEQNAQFDVDVTDGYGWTALMCASCSGALQSVQYLLDRGANRRAVDKSGTIAWQLARKNGHLAVAKLLLKSDNVETETAIQSKKLSIGSVFQSPGELVNQSTGKSPLLESRRRDCLVCRSTFCESDWKRHLSSTLHQFNSGRLEDRRGTAYYHIPESNMGFQLMLKDGWNREQGLGPHGEGMKYPPKTVLKRDREGLGNRPKSKARITHFGPNDLSALKRRSKPCEVQTLSKRDRLRKVNIDRQKEIFFRRQLNSS